MRDDLNRDLGLGGIMSQQKRLRLLNRDGSFNFLHQLAVGT